MKKTVDKFGVRRQAQRDAVFQTFREKAVSPLRSAIALEKIGKYLLLIAALASVSVFGADAQSLKPLAPPSTSFGVAFFRMIGSLAFVVAVFFGGAWLFRNMHRFRQTGSHARKLHVLEAKSLGARQAIYVVGFEQQRMLIGCTAQGLTLLTHLPDGEPQGEAERIVPVSFGEALMQALGRK
jgi:flagellar biogenesis protein FliO